MKEDRPILERKRHGDASVFTPDKLLREARRQKSLPAGAVPKICVLDPDGDLANELAAEGARRSPYWACYHTELHELELACGTVGVVGRAVGAPFAVLVAEELFASGCELLVSVTSAGQIAPVRDPPYFVLIERALRDEGTSYHYLPPARYVRIGAAAMTVAQPLLASADRVVPGGSWTTDAPFRETAAAIAFARAENLLAVEMEAAALYALAQAKGYPIVCIAHVTNAMDRRENDFEKGERSGNAAFVRLITTLAQSWRDRPAGATAAGSRRARRAP